MSAEYPSHQTAVQAHQGKTLAEWVAHHWPIFCRVWLTNKALQSRKCRAKCVSLYYPWVALMWSLQTDEYKLHSGARLQAGKRQAKTKEQFVAQVGVWRCSRQQGQQITAAGLPWPHLCPPMRWRWTTALTNIQLMKQLFAFMKLVG